MSTNGPDHSDPVPPRIDTRAPDAPSLTSYDRMHHRTYLRLLDAEAAGTGWREAARSILLLDCDANAIAARSTWQSHLDRARWMTTTGFRQLLEEGLAARKSAKS